MKTVLVTGVCVIDFIFQLDEIPKTYEKFRANDAFITGGGPAANAAVTVSRLGGSATLASRLGEDEVTKLIMSDLVNEGINTKTSICLLLAVVIVLIQVFSRKFIW